MLGAVQNTITMCDHEFNLKRLGTARSMAVKVKCMEHIVQVFVYDAYVEYMRIQIQRVL